jgi:hypothetical protein
MAKLALNDCLQTQVFRKIVQIYKDNPILRRTIKPTSWFVWDGRPDMKDDPFIQGNLPAIRLTPTAQPARPLTNVRFESQFLIRQEIGIPGLNIDDAMNLWYAIHATIFTGDGSKAALQALGTLSLSVTPPGQNVISLGLGTPSFTPIATAVGSEMIVADGDIWINMMVPR